MVIVLNYPEYDTPYILFLMPVRLRELPMQVEMPQAMYRIPLMRLPTEGAVKLSSLVDVHQDLIATTIDLSLSLSDCGGLYVSENHGLFPLSEPLSTRHCLSLLSGETDEDRHQRYVFEPFTWYIKSNAAVMLCRREVLEPVMSAHHWPEQLPAWQSTFGWLRSLLHEVPSLANFRQLERVQDWDLVTTRYVKESVQRWPAYAASLSISPRSRPPAEYALRMYYEHILEDYRQLDEVEDFLWCVQALDLYYCGPWSLDAWSTLLMHTDLTQLRVFQLEVAPHSQADLMPGVLMSHLSSAVWAESLEHLHLTDVFVDGASLVEFMHRNSELSVLELNAVGTGVTALVEYLASGGSDFHERCVSLALTQNMSEAHRRKPPYFNAGESCVSSNHTVNHAHTSFHSTLNYALTFERWGYAEVTLLSQWLRTCTAIESLDISWLVVSFDMLSTLLMTPLPATLRSVKINAKGEEGDVALFTRCVERWSKQLSTLELAGVELSAEVCSVLSKRNLSGSTLTELGVTVGPELLTGCDLHWLDVLCQRGLKHLTLYSSHRIDVEHLELFCRLIAHSSIERLSCHFLVRRAAPVRVPLHKTPTIEQCGFKLFEYTVSGAGRDDSPDWVKVNCVCTHDCMNCPMYS